MEEFEDIKIVEVTEVEPCSVRKNNSQITLSLSATATQEWGAILSALLRFERSIPFHCFVCNKIVIECQLAKFESKIKDLLVKRVTQTNKYYRKILPKLQKRTELINSIKNSKF